MGKVVVLKGMVPPLACIKAKVIVLTDMGMARTCAATTVPLAGMGLKDTALLTVVVRMVTDRSDNRQI